MDKPKDFLNIRFWLIEPDSEAGKRFRHYLGWPKRMAAEVEAWAKKWDLSWIPTKWATRGWETYVEAIELPNTRPDDWRGKPTSMELPKGWVRNKHHRDYARPARKGKTKQMAAELREIRAGTFLRTLMDFDWRDGISHGHRYIFDGTPYELSGCMLVGIKEPLAKMIEDRQYPLPEGMLLVTRAEVAEWFDAEEKFTNTG